MPGLIAIPERIILKAVLKLTLTENKNFYTRFIVDMKGFV